MYRFSQGHNFKKTALWILPWVALIVLGLWLRIGSLEERTVHADEAVQGIIFADLLESGDYAYNPQKFHGPSLYYLTLPVAWLRGQSTREELDVVTLRLVPMFFSLILAFSPFLFRKELGNPGVLVACGFLLMSPCMVYFSDYYIQETLLITGFSLFIGSYWRYRASPDWRWAVAMGLAAGLMVATKESGLLYIAIVLVFGGLFARKRQADSGHRTKDILIAFSVACLVAVPLFSSFGSNPHGLLDAIAGLWKYEPELGHDKPWNYYLSLISGASRSGFPFHGEGLLLISAVAGMGYLVVKDRTNRLFLFLSSTGASLIVLFSVVPYKTPWLVLGMLLPMALIVGLSAERFFKATGPVWRITLGITIAALWCLLLKESIWTTRTFPVEKRNPYAYVHTSWDMEELTDRIIELSKNSPLAVVKVISDEYWPIPWYLKSLDQVGYWTNVPQDPYSPIMVVSAELAGELDPERMKEYHYEFRGLRPGKILLLYWTE